MSRNSIQLVSFMFVDDKDLITTATRGETHQSLITSAQGNIDDWQRGLGVLGGALRHDKCYWYYVGFKWTAGKWQYVKAQDAQGELTIVDGGNRCTIERLEADEAHTALGSEQSPSGDMKAEVNAICN